MIGQLTFKIWLLNVAVANVRVIGSTDDGPELMDAAIACSIASVDETNFQDRPKAFDERWRTVGRASAMRHKIKERILRLFRMRLARIWNEKPSGTANCGLA